MLVLLVYLTVYLCLCEMMQVKDGICFMRLRVCMLSMPQRPSMYRSFVTCSDPEGVVVSGTVRKVRLEKMERRNMPKCLNISCSSRGLREEGVGNLSYSSSQLGEIEKGAQKLNKMIDSWASGMSIDGQSKDIAQDLLRGALDLQESLNMLSKLQEESLFMAKLKRLEKQDEIGRVSVDGSARSKCGDELKKVIQECLVRQKLLPINYGESPCHRRGISFGSEGQSTSSGQSSVKFSKKACSTDNSSESSDISVKNRKRSNLIAKLMGLDEGKLVHDIKANTSTASNGIQDEKRIPTFDIDLPKSKEPHVSRQMRYQEKRTLRELLESTQSKADFERKSIDRRMPVLDLIPRTNPKSRNETDKFPPIVLMKPLHIPYKEFEKSPEQSFNASEIVKELKAKNWFSHAQDQVSERAPLMKDEKNSPGTPRIATPETSKLAKSAVAKLQSTKTKITEKAVVSVEQTSRANIISKIVKSPDVSNSTKIVAKEKHVRGTKTKLLVSKENLGSPMKASNPDKNLSVVKTQTSVPLKLTRTKVSKFTKESSTDNSVGVKQTQKRKGKPVTQPPSGDTFGHEEVAAAVDLSCQVTYVVPLPVRTKTIAEAAIEENWRDVEVIHDTSVQERSNKYYNDVSCEKVTSNTSGLKSRSFHEDLLMTSPSFAAFVEVLFHLGRCSWSSTSVKPSIDMDTDTTLFISYAKEVLERRSNHLLFSATSVNIPVSLNQLLEELRDAYDAIDSYKDGETISDILDMLDRDMKCKEIVSSVWDLGWQNGRPAAETEQIVANLEKLILRDFFIDEIFAP